MNTTVFDYEPDHSSAKQFTALAQEILDRIAALNDERLAPRPAVRDGSRPITGSPQTGRLAANA